MTKKVTDVTAPAQLDLPTLRRMIVQLNQQLRLLERRVQALENG